MHLKPWLFIGALLAAVRLLATDAQPSPATGPTAHAQPSAADVAWAELQSPELLNYRRPENFQELTTRQKVEVIEQVNLRVWGKGLAFYAAFPNDPRRWEVAYALLFKAPRFITAYGPNIDRDWGDVTVDAAQAETAKAKVAELRAALERATDLPASVRESLDGLAVTEIANRAAFAQWKGQPMDWQPLGPALVALAAKYPASEHPVQIARNLMYQYERNNRPAESAAVWRTLVPSANAKVAAMAREKVRVFDAIGGPLELTFTALDGSVVDLGKLRGKVVLLDFWATWCGPCMAEMPNVKKVYETYHQHGFEVIGVSCDTAQEPGGTSKMKKTAAELMAFCRKNGMPWPQHFEGRPMGPGGNTLVARFGVTMIPASFLYDQTGHLVAVNVVGHELEAEVKRLMSL